MRGPLASTGNQSIFINDPSRPPSAPIGNQRRLGPMLPSGFGPSLSDPRLHASDPPMCRATEPSYWPEMRDYLIAHSRFRLWEGE